MTMARNVRNALMNLADDPDFGDPRNNENKEVNTNWIRSHRECTGICGARHEAMYHCNPAEVERALNNASSRQREAITPLYWSVVPTCT